MRLCAKCVTRWQAKDSLKRAQMVKIGTASAATVAMCSSQKSTAFKLRKGMSNRSFRETGPRSDRTNEWNRVATRVRDLRQIEVDSFCRPR